MNSSLISIAFLFGLLSSGWGCYDPLHVESKVAIKRTEFSYRERSVPLKVYLPESQKPAPVILLSHGLGGSREGCSYLGEQWAKRGFVVVAMQHAGSDSSVWKDEPLAVRQRKIKQAANAQNLRRRTGDVPATLDQLEEWQETEGHFLQGRMNLEKMGIGGHSFGALTSQALAGQHFGKLGALYRDERIDAALLLSPTPPRLGSVANAFGKITIPTLAVTGTKDDSPIGNHTPERRMAVFPALPAGDKFELVLKDADHFAFGDSAAMGLPKNPNHHRVIAAITTAFWESFLKEDSEATVWLGGKELPGILEDGDRWQAK